jgi:hypothetical protein
MVEEGSLGGGSNGQISVPPGLFMASADDVVVDDDRTKVELEVIVEALLLVEVETTKAPTDGMDTRTVPIVHTPSFIVVMESGFPSLFLVTLGFGKSVPCTLHGSSGRSAESGDWYSYLPAVGKAGWSW